MKKTLVLLLICSLIVVAAGSALGATKLDSDTTTVCAYVAPYASVKWISADPLNFSGKAHETQYGKATYFVESNSPIIGKTEGGDFATVVPFVGSYKLDTNYSAFPGPLGFYPYKAGQEFQSVETFFLGKRDVNVYYKAQTGAISDQPAGAYATYLTTTIYTRY